MEKNIIICLVEGFHDAAFIQEILKYNGFNKFKGQVKDLPSPISNLYTNPKNIYNSEVENLSHEIAHKRISPYSIMQLEHNLIVIFSTNGLDSASLRLKIIQSITDLKGEDLEEGEADFATNNFHFLYIWDADHVGTSDRLEEIRNEISMLSNENDVPAIPNGSFLTINQISFGAYIITEQGVDFGKLEDILIPLMETDNEDIFEKARGYLSIHEETNLFRGKVKYKDEENTIIKSVNRVKYDSNKSLIGTVGQLQKSGMPNTVCITQTDFLNQEKVQMDASCNEILTFIRKVIV